MRKQDILTGEVLVHIHSDQHVGSKIGLSPPKWHVGKGPERIDYSQSPIQALVYNHWESCWNWAFSQKIPVVGIDNGDNIEGDHHGTFGIWSKNPQDQADVSVGLLLPKRRKCERWYCVRGTPSHIGQEGQWEEYIAKEIGADAPAGDTFSTYHIEPEISGVLFNIAHHGPRPGKRPWTVENSLRDLAKGICMDAMLKGRRPPDVIVRSHVHWDVHVIVTLNGHNCHAFITPAFQAKSEYAHKVITESDEARMGSTYVRVKDGFVLDAGFKVLELPSARSFKA